MSSKPFSNMSCRRFWRPTTRREFLARAGGGLGMLALANLLSEPAPAMDVATSALDDLAPRPPHFPPKVRSVIWLFMEGAPSAVDMFDPTATPAR
jgi:hypothetical protein